MWPFQKPSITASVLNGSCGSGKQGRVLAFNKRGFLEDYRMAASRIKLPFGETLARFAYCSKSKIRGRPTPLHMPLGYSARFG